MRLPGTEDRTVVIGRTGSGKTHCGLFLLSRMDMQSQPWIIWDFKREKLIRQIPYVTELQLGEIPQEPGLYVVRPMVYDLKASRSTDMSPVDEYLTAIWEHENIGLFIDEGFMLRKSSAMDVIYIQGRSKHIPVITLTQRPVGISRFAFSEANFFADFPTTDKREQNVINEFTPLFEKGHNDLLPKYYFWWYEVGGRLERVRPVPSLDRILATFEQELAPPVPDELSEPVQERVKKRFATL